MSNLTHGQFLTHGVIRYEILGLAPAGENTKRSNPRIVGLLGLRRADGTEFASWLFTDGTHGKLTRA